MDGTFAPNTALHIMNKQRKNFFGGNWKMNGSKESIDAIIAFLSVTRIPDDADVVVAPPAIYLDYVRNKLPANIQVAAQNCYKIDKGAFTGEISVEMIKDLHCTSVILGHGERRHTFGETDELIAEKAKYAISNGLDAIFCIGETEDERHNDTTYKVLFRQLQAVTGMLQSEDWAKLVICYEPVWAIGTGKTPVIAEIQEIHQKLREWIQMNIDHETADSTRIIYGGSVNRDNCDQMVCQPDIDGFLVGRAALTQDFIIIINSANHQDIRSHQNSEIPSVLDQGSINESNVSVLDGEGMITGHHVSRVTVQIPFYETPAKDTTEPTIPAIEMDHVSEQTAVRHRKFFVGGNWKMNGNKESIDVIIAFLNDAKISDADIVVAPPGIYLDYVRRKLSRYYDVGIQNCYKVEKGAFTGEISVDMLKDLDCTWVILGHGERRQIFGETDQLIGEKTKYVLTNGLRVILCIGETVAERDSGQTYEVLFRQLKAVTDILETNDWAQLVICYEPVWAIGTGETPAMVEIQEIHMKLREWLRVHIDPDIVDNTRIIYGGSVNKDNCEGMASGPDIDGFLVGRAALTKDFIRIINCSHDTERRSAKDAILLFESSAGPGDHTDHKKREPVQNSGSGKGLTVKGQHASPNASMLAMLDGVITVLGDTVSLGDGTASNKATQMKDSTASNTLAVGSNIAKTTDDPPNTVKKDKTQKEINADVLDKPTTPTKVVEQERTIRPKEEKTSQEMPSENNNKLEDKATETNKSGYKMNEKNKSEDKTNEKNKSEDKSKDQEGNKPKETSKPCSCLCTCL